MGTYRYDKKGGEIRKQKKGMAPGPLFLLVLSIFLMGSLNALGEAARGIAGGPSTEEWTLRNWGKAFGGDSDEEAFAMALTSDGGCILAGRTYTFDPSSGYGDAWLVKLGPDGDVEWEKRYGGSLWDAVFVVQQTPDGGFIAAGERYPPGGSLEVWVMKLKFDGEIYWQNTYGRADHYDSGLSVRSTADGGFILLGRTQSHAVGGEQGAWVLKLTGSGGIEWQKFLGGSDYDILFSVEQTTDGGYVLAGGTYSYSHVPGFSDVWMVKMSRNGDVAWEKTYGGIYDDVAYSVKQTEEGGYVLACWTSFGYGDIWALKTDMDGNVEWQKRYGGTEGDVPTSLRQTSDGGFVISGYTSSFGSGSYDAWAFKLAGNGRIEWQKTFGGNGIDAFNGIEETATGYGATGYTGSFGAGGKDFWYIHFTPVGPGTHLLHSFSGPSHAVSPPMEVTESPLIGFIRATRISPVASVTTTSETASKETVLSESPGNGNPPSKGVIVMRAAGNIPWPVYPKDKRMKK